MTQTQIKMLPITELSDKGNGRGLAKKDSGESIKVEVPFTVPGDLIAANLRHRKKDVHIGNLEIIKTPSVDRVEPRCNHFGVCGGCRWQQVSYQKQLEYKENFVRRFFSDLLTEETEFLPIIPSKVQWGYRNKMEFSFSSDKQGRRFLGLFMDSQKGKVMNLAECHLVKPWFIETLNAVRHWWEESELLAFHPLRNTGSLRTVTMREGQRTGDRMVILTVSGNPDYALKHYDLESFIAIVKAAADTQDPEKRLSIFLRIQQTAKGMSTNFYEMHLYGSDQIREVLKVQTKQQGPTIPLTFSIGPSSFFQPNSMQAEVFYSRAIQLLGIQDTDTVYDLYCGTGTLGMCAASNAKQVIGVEFSPESVLDAKANAQHNGIENIEIISGAVRYVLKQMIEEKEFPKPDIVMVDPPRPGLEAVALNNLIFAEASKILYLSCNPKTQASDIAELLKNGYKLKTVQPIDQFPQTYHVENIAILTK